MYDVHERTEVGRNRVEPDDDRVRIVEREQRQTIRNLDGALRFAAGEPTKQVLGRPLGGVSETFHRCELEQLRLRDVARCPVADRDLVV